MDMRVSISAESLASTLVNMAKVRIINLNLKSSGRFITSDQHSLV